jgi:primosomal protein N' (replication factor Y)
LGTAPYSLIIFVIMDTELFADVILPLAIPNFYTYAVPSELKEKIKVGQRVVVQFGKKKLYTALVYKIHSNKPELYKAKTIESILDAEPVVNEKQFQLWKWLANYYMCTPGEVMNAALPSGLKLSSETKILLNPNIKINSKELSDDEFLIYEALLKNETLTLNEAEQIVQPHPDPPQRRGREQKSTSQHLSSVKSLLEKKVIIIYEELKEKYKPKIEEFVRLTEYASNEETLKKIFDELEKKAFKQLEVLMEYIRLSGLKTEHSSNTQWHREVKKSELLKRKNISSSVLDALVKKNIFTVYKKETGRFASEESSAESKTLTEEQQKAYQKIKDEWKEKDVVLFHGVTSSGKTEIYVKHIQEVVQQGKQVLYLLPEIAITTQVVSRIKKYFGDSIGVYHSRFNENERVEIWNRVLKFQSTSSINHMGDEVIQQGKEETNQKFSIILGARSALFLPFSNLGLIIVDEEHDSSYKQFDPAPRYHARDSAIMLAKFHGAKVLLGSATPSVESYYNAMEKKYGLVQLFTRYGGVQLPEILIADIKDDTKRKKMKSHFSPLLLEHVEQALKNKEQVILFQNRRGFAPYLECKTCGWIPKCKNCDVSLVYHKSGNQLRCHYCGYMTTVPSVCNACGSADVLMKNFGTEKIEDDLQIFFPQARIARMDYDSTRSRLAYQQLLNNFEEGNIDVLVGTQMVTKGLDFENVSTVGILSADLMLNFPDFRSHERTFQMLAQVAGRAGRKNKRGKVILQTYWPKHPVIQHVINNDFEKLYREEIAHRKNFQYPPFHRLIELTVMDKDIHKVSVASDELAKKLRNLFGKRILGPEFPLVPRIKNVYLIKIIIKIAKEESAYKVKEKIRSLIIDFQKEPAYRGVSVKIDVDPM